MEENLVPVEIDVIEIYLNMIKNDTEINSLTCNDIANLIQNRFGIKCTEGDIFLLHEPEVYDVWYEDAYYYKNVLGI